MRISRGIGRDLGLDLSRLRGIKLAVEPGKEFLVLNRHRHSPTSANSAVRPRTSRLDTVPIGRSSISAASR